MQNKINESKISLILPVYNVERYIDQCMKSVLVQSYRNLEIILIDDGSEDSSGKICDHYAKKDSRIIVLHKENGGLSDARNYGINAATGEYIICIDSDDFVDKDYVEYLYSLIQRFHTRMAICQHKVLFPNGKFQDKSLLKEDEKLTAKECIEKMLYHDVIDTSAWAKIYEKSLFDDIKYPKGKLYEDIATTYKLMNKSGSIAIGYQSKYNYIVRKNSIVNRAFSRKKFDLIKMTDAMGQEVTKWYPDLRDAVRRRQAYARFSTLNQMIGVRGVEKERKKIIDELKGFRKTVMRDKKAPRRDKAAFILLTLGYPIYAHIWQIWLKKEGR